MKVGIITWFKYDNYGTALQAIALQKFLRESLKMDAELIDFPIPAIPKRKKRSSLYDYLGKIYYHLMMLNSPDYCKETSEKFRRIIKDNCKISRHIRNKDDYVDVCNEFDVLICGSDQIWNPNWFHPFYYAGYDEIRTRRISYAPSFGVSVIPKKLESNYKMMLDRFSKLSVREDAGKKIIADITDKAVDIVLDPTLLIESSEWEKMESKEYVPDDDYLLCYMLSDNKRHWKSIRRFAKNNNLKMVVIPHDPHSYMQPAEVIRGCGVEDFLGLIHGAKYVITDSFHGTIFSVIYKKDVAVFERHNPAEQGSQNSRIYNLLEKLHLESVLLKYDTDYVETINKIDYDEVYNYIRKEKAHSTSFIKEGIREVK